MSKALDRRERPLDTIRRLVASEIGQALRRLETRGGPRDEAIHDARKRLKRARGALRLARAIPATEA